MTPHKINDLQMFIAGWYLDDTSICDEIIEFHKQSDNKYDGVSSKGVDKTVKDSKDVNLVGGLANKYGMQLQKVVDKYVEKYQYCDNFSPWRITSYMVAQHYTPGGGYHAWHCERSTCKEPSQNRHLVFMTYLNDVDDAGETEFFYQKIKIKPEKGLTLIWPVDWTFTHRGITSPTQEKYVATGWFNFVE